MTVDEGSDLHLVFEVYRTHLTHVFLYNFPDHYGDVLRLILKGMIFEQSSAYRQEDLSVYENDWQLNPFTYQLMSYCTLLLFNLKDTFLY